ncbi:hypothetical protein BASA62_001039 [Batrachochytrium salamandrivorans]|nr:hypothetical protein BASA62_001039 [Batrachochytrium salamandrivorans]
MLQYLIQLIGPGIKHAANDDPGLTSKRKCGKIVDLNTCLRFPPPLLDPPQPPSSSFCLLLAAASLRPMLRWCNAACNAPPVASRGSSVRAPARTHTTMPALRGYHDREPAVHAPLVRPTVPHTPPRTTRSRPRSHRNGGDTSARERGRRKSE